MVSASGCGPEGRGFESHISPQKKRKAPHGPGESPSVQVSKDRQQTRRPSGHLHTGRCFLPNKALRGRKKESTPRRADRKTESGCSAVGSARGLGACDRLVSRPPKARKISVFLAFSRFSVIFMLGKKLLTTDLTTYGFDRKIEYFHPSGCGAAGSARSLGLRCRRFESGHSDQKSVENEVFHPTFG